MTTPLLPPEATQAEENRLGRVRYTHDAMIDLIIQNPGISQNSLATHFGYRPSSISRIVNSDSFRARLAERRTEIVDPSIVASIEEKFAAMVDQSLEILAEKLGATQSADLALKTLELGAKALGYGARQQTAVQNNFVVALPVKAQDASSWAEAHTPKSLGQVVEVAPGQLTPGLQALVEKAA